MPLPAPRPLPALAALLALAAAAPPVAASGQPDPGFGTGGVVLVPFDTPLATRDSAQDVLVDRDGRIVVAGASGAVSAGDNGDIAVVRLLADGSLDPAFGSGGRRTIAFDLGGANDEASRILETSDGRYVLCGIAEDDPSRATSGSIVVVRLLENGGFDTSFDLDGRRIFELRPPGRSGVNFFVRCAIDGADRIVVSSGLENELEPSNRVVLTRLSTDGSTDTSFGSDGIVEPDLPSGTIFAALLSGLAVDPGGDIIAAGALNVATSGPLNLDMFVLRLREDGSQDPDFGDGGVRVIAFDQGSDLRDGGLSLALQRDGRIVVAGVSSTPVSGDDIALARVLPDGDLDPAFGTGGRALVGLDAGGSLVERGEAVVVDRDGRILVAGEADVAEGNVDAVVLALTPSGLPDPGFGDAGWTRIGIDTSSSLDRENFLGIALDHLDRPVVAGQANTGPESGNYDMLVARLTGTRVFGDGFEPQD